VALDPAQVGVEAGRELLERRFAGVGLGRSGQLRRRLLERSREVGLLGREVVEEQRLLIPASRAIRAMLSSS
jgi:hypothetical protein